MDDGKVPAHVSWREASAPPGQGELLMPHRSSRHPPRRRGTCRPGLAFIRPGAALALVLAGCENSPAVRPDPPAVTGCDGQAYILPDDSPYVLPYAVGAVFETGLTNCSSSYHGPGKPDQYAFDFRMPEGTPFIATRAGKVVIVVEDAPSEGGGVGNYVVVDHLDGTHGLYYHSPQDGIAVEVGEDVEQGTVLGVTGRSGLAGYPHLHFTVVEGDPSFPYH